jgi:hypothetical protein
MNHAPHWLRRGRAIASVFAATVIGTCMAACKPDFETLGACPAAEPCPRSFVQMVEGAPPGVSVSPACALRALRDRLPGRYRHETDSTWTSGSVGSRHLILVTASGDALYARDPYGHDLGRPPPPDVALPAQRCRLKPAAYFDQCLAALAANDPFSPVRRDCIYAGDVTSTGPMQWFDSCVSESPVRCE